MKKMNLELNFNKMFDTYRDLKANLSVQCMIKYVVLVTKLSRSIYSIIFY